jgi:hypothetical protein
LFVFAVAALSGPGRIDIVDGQTRFEAGRSLALHGDSALRDERIWWGSFPGRDGNQFTYYRFPQSVLAAGAILIADATGAASEGRRHFFFVWTSAAAAALLAVLYAVGFRLAGLSERAALLWGLGGFFATPAWFYSTSVFDDILGTSVVVAIAVTARLAGQRSGWRWLVITSLLLALAFNVKQPLAVFALPALVLQDRPGTPRVTRLFAAVVIALGPALGLLIQDLYDSWKFPFDKRVVHAELLKQYAPVYTSDPLPALACFLLSPGCGVFFYCPPALLGLLGVWKTWRDGDRPLAAAVVGLTVVYIGFHCFVSFFKGDPAWGPRYLTPWFGFLWLFAPRGAALVSRAVVVSLVGAGVAVQLLALAVDPHRLFIANKLPSAVGAAHPWLYFEPGFSQLLQRPREIKEILGDSGRAPEYTPAPAPTFTFPVIDPPYLPESGPDVVDRYQVLRGFRPWWISQRCLSAEQRPVAIDQTLAALGGVGLAGLGLLFLGYRSLNSRNDSCRTASGG